MELSKTKKHIELQKELTDVLRDEREIILMEFEKSFKKQKEEIIEGICEEFRTSFNNEIDNLYKKIEKKIHQAEQNICADMHRAVSNPEDDKYKGYLVKPGKCF